MWVPAQALNAAFAKEPELDGMGLTSRPRDGLSRRDVWFFDACCELLAKCRRAKKINRNDKSIALKHWVVEGHEGPHGLFIAAVIHLGIPFERCGASVYLAIRPWRPKPLPYAW